MTIEQVQADIDEYQKKIAPLAQYGGTQPTGSEFEEELRKRLTRPENVEDLIKNIATQRSRMLAVPAETRAQAPIGVYSPTQMAGLVEQRQEPVRATWETLMGVKSAREGKLEDVISRAVRGYEDQIAKQESKYEKEQQKLQDLIEERNWLTQQTQWQKEFGLEERRVAVAEKPTGEPTVEKEAIADAFANQVNSGTLDLVNVPSEYRGAVAVKLNQTQAKAEWSKEVVQGLKEQGQSDDMILAAAREDGVEEQVRAWLEELYGGRGGLLSKMGEGAEYIKENFPAGISRIKSWLSGK